MKILSNKAFSFVEIIVVITILTLIAVVGISLNNGYREKTYNTKVTTDLDTLESALLVHKQEKGYIPTPEGNLKYFANDGSYAHDETDAYGVHGFITEKTISKKYIKVLPRDPKSNQYYAYGKILNSGFFEIAGILSHSDKFESIVRGNYQGKDSLYNIIREYNGPDYVYDKSDKNFPYNPDQMILTAKISDYNGNLVINDEIIDKKTILERQLVSGDNIKLSTGATATIYYSDGTISYLGSNLIECDDQDYSSDPNNPEKTNYCGPMDITLSLMKYKKEDNLSTKIRIALNFGTILTKASKMSKDSDFELYTTDTEASVRGTIFRMTRYQSGEKTYLEVIRGSIFIYGITIPTYKKLVQMLKDDEEITPKVPIISPIPGITELVTNDDGVVESLLKEPNSIYILPSIPGPITLPVCPTGRHKESTVCKLDIENCDILDTSGNKIGEGNRIWNITRPIKCDALSCISGYSIVGKDCIKNTKENVSCTGLPNFAERNLVDKINQSLNSSNAWEPSEVGVYNINYSNIECRFKCKPNYTWNIVSKTCKADVKYSACIGGIPLNAKKITGDQFTQTFNGTIFAPVSKNRGYNQSECGFVCLNSNYVYQGGICKLNTYTKQASCGGSNPPLSYKTTSNTYTQNCVGNNCTPNLSWGYNQSTCGFKCNSGLERKNGSCVANCPSGFTDVGGGYCKGSGKGCTSLCEKAGIDRKSGFACFPPFGNRYELYCTKITETIGGKGVACFRQKAYTTSNCPWSKAEDVQWTGYYKK